MQSFKLSARLSGAWVTTFLGFATLVNVSAEPLRQLGMGGIVGAVVAPFMQFPVVSGVPAFLPRERSRNRANQKVKSPGKSHGFVRYGTGFILVLIAVALMPGLTRLNTDPSLLSYFEEGSELHEGLAFVDQNGGKQSVETRCPVKKWRAT